MSFDKDAVTQLTRIADALEKLIGFKTVIGQQELGRVEVLTEEGSDELLDDLPPAKSELDEQVPGIELNAEWNTANDLYNDAKSVYHDNLDDVLDLAKKKEECQKYNQDLQTEFAKLQDDVSDRMNQYPDQKLPKKEVTAIRKLCNSAKKTFKQIAADAVDAYNEAEKASSNNSEDKVEKAKERVENFQKENEAILKDLNQHMSSVESKCNKKIGEQLIGDAAKEVREKFQKAVSGAKKSSNLVVKQADGQLLTDEQVYTIKDYWSHVVSVTNDAITEAEEKALDAEKQDDVKNALTKEDVTDKAKAFATANSKEEMASVLKDAFGDLPGDIGAITKLGDLDSDDVTGSQRQAAYKFIINKFDTYGQPEEIEEEDDLLG